jgi:hypothetical protein
MPTDDEENDDAHAALAATGLTLLRAWAAGPDPMIEVV